MRPDASSAESAANTGNVFRCAGVALLRTPLLPLHQAAEAAVALTVHPVAFTDLVDALGRLWRSVTARMRRLQPTRYVVTTDLRLDAGVTLPRKVAEEAEHAAEVENFRTSLNAYANSFRKSSGASR